jgi:hypothetical protein
LEQILASMVESIPAAREQYGAGVLGPAKERYWRGLLRQSRQSGLTARDFCAEHGISVPSFYFWRREIDRRDRQRKLETNKAAEHTSSTTLSSADLATPAFVSLAMDACAPLPPAIEVVVAERRLLRVRRGFDAELLRQLVRLLEEPSC